MQGHEAIELRGISQCMNLKSPHLVTIFDVRYNEQGRPFVIMEFVAGPSLRQLIDESPAGLGTQKTAFFLREMAKGLTYLHDRGIVHRDLKPGNVFYEDGYVKIGDYGLSKAISESKHSGQTITVGTVHYMAPEIGQGNYDRGIDIYALGCMTYEMLTGQTPYLGASPGEILMKHMVDEPDLAGIEEPFATAIRKAIAKDPKDRFQTAQQMVEAVFGAAHIQQSVSCFSPDSLTMVADRVARKVSAGGPGSSGNVGLGEERSVPDAADDRQNDWADRLDRKMDRVEQRLEKAGEKISKRFERARERMREKAARKKGQTAADSPQQAGSAVQEGPPVDPKRDPLGRLQRVVLCIAGTAALGVGTGAIIGNTPGWSGRSVVSGFAVFVISLYACGGLALAERVFGRQVRSEPGVVQHLAYGGLSAIMAGLWRGDLRYRFSRHCPLARSISLAMEVWRGRFWLLLSPCS